MILLSFSDEFESLFNGLGMSVILLLGVYWTGRLTSDQKIEALRPFVVVD